MSSSQYTFVDFFCGIWWFHIAFSNLWAKCLAACDIDKFARITYEHNFKKRDPEIFENWLFFEDINKVESVNIPDFDIFCWWFPCQPFSQAGYKLWFEDHRWNLFFEIARIIKNKRPKAFFLENVRHLENHDWWKTLEVIKDVLMNELWYTFDYKIIKASDYWLPQHRARIFMVWFDKNLLPSIPPWFIFPTKQKLELSMSDILWGYCDKKIWYTLRVGWRWSGIDDRRNRDGYIVNGKEVRLWVEEGKKMMGFPKEFEFPVSETQAMKQLWNSVAINPIQSTAQAMIRYMNQYFISSELIHDNVKSLRTEWILRIPQVVGW